MKLFIILLILFICSNVFAASLEVPLRCYKQTLTEEFAKEGIILDEDNEDAHGYIENRGTSYVIHLYYNPNDYSPFVDVPLRVNRMKREKR